MIKVSIIVVSHNRPEMLKQAIDSCINQTLHDIEIIVIDDGSTNEEVFKVINIAVKQDSRIKFYKTTEEINNLSIVWNLGIDIANGAFITTLDDDNMKLPEFCEKMVNALESNPEYSAAACYMQCLRNNKLAETFDGPAKMNRNNILKKNYVDSGSMMYRRELFEKIGYFDEKLDSAEDWDFVKRIVFETEKGLLVVSEILMIYRWHKRQRTNRKRGTDKDKMNKNYIVNEKIYGKKCNLNRKNSNLKLIYINNKPV